jgi:triacylglycerol lipase
MFHAGLSATDRLEELLGTEALATLREVALLPRDIAPVLPQAAPGDDVVVLVHGFMASAGVFRPMRARLEAEAEARVATFTHAPTSSIRAVARQLARLVARIPLGTRIHIVGHSLGGVVARWFVQEHPEDARIVQTISLASPFGGSDVARRLPVFVGAELHASSALLARLRHGVRAACVAHTSIVAGEDRVVPPGCAAFPHGDVVVLPGRGHNSLLFDPDVTRHVIDRIRRMRQ